MSIMKDFLSEAECRERYYTSKDMPVIIDAHSHLWLWQHTEVCGKTITQTEDGRSMFLGNEVQMMNPWMHDNMNSAEKFIANMMFAQVGGAVVTQEFIDGLQNDYLEYVGKRWADTFFTYGMCEFRKPGFIVEVQTLLRRGFRGIKLCAGRVADQQEMDGAEATFTNEEFMQMYHIMEDNNMILALELRDGDCQVAEAERIIAECPNLRIVIGHFCMVNRPDWQKQMMLCRHKNVYTDMGGITWLYNNEYYPYPSAIKAIRESIDLVGAEKLLWGSDYPRTISNITYRQSYDWILKTTELTETEKRLILGENAQKLYGFNNLPTRPYIKSMSE